MANVTGWVTATMTSGGAFWWLGPNGVGHTVDIVSHDNGATWEPSGFGQRPGPVLRGVLTGGEAQALSAKLPAAIRSLDRGAPGPACNQLRRSPARSGPSSTAAS